MAFPISQRAARGLGPAYSAAVGIQTTELLRRANTLALAKGTEVASTAGKAFFNALNEYRSGKGGSRSIASANQRIMSQARDAVLASYDERVTSREHFAPYRVGENRNSGGALRRALEDPAMFVGTYNGLTFMNVAVLDREASHWARLNWGAGERAGDGYTATPVRLQVFGESLGALTPPTHPQPSFSIPRGLWVGSEWQRSLTSGHGGTHVVRWGNRAPGFYPTSKEVFFPTRGIAARRFFDAAYASIAETMPIEYENLLHEWIDQAQRTAKGLAARTLKAQYDITSVGNLNIGAVVGGGAFSSVTYEVA